MLNSRHLYTLLLDKTRKSKTVQITHFYHDATSSSAPHLSQLLSSLTCQIIIRHIYGIRFSTCIHKHILTNVLVSNRDGTGSNGLFPVKESIAYMHVGPGSGRSRKEKKNLLKMQTLNLELIFWTHCSCYTGLYQPNNLHWEGNQNHSFGIGSRQTVTMATGLEKALKSSK